MRETMYFILSYSQINFNGNNRNITKRFFNTNRFILSVFFPYKVYFVCKINSFGIKQIITENDLQLWHRFHKLLSVRCVTDIITRVFFCIQVFILVVSIANNKVRTVLKQSIVLPRENCSFVRKDRNIIIMVF